MKIESKKSIRDVGVVLTSGGTTESILMKGEKTSDSEGKQHFKLRSCNKLVFLRAMPSQFVDPSTLKHREGIVQLVLTSSNGERLRYPLLNYRVMDPNFPDFSQSIKDIVQ